MSFIGGAIKREREAAGLTSKQIAERTGLSQQYIGDIQHGRRLPSVETMLLIANQFPDVDSTWWAWLLLRDSWGNEMAEAMRRHAVAVALRDE